MRTLQRRLLADESRRARYGGAVRRCASPAKAHRAVILGGVRLQVLSDLHLERGGGPPPATEADVLVLAGDIGPGVDGLRAAAAWWPDRPILYVSGNHEPYGGGLPEITARLRAAAAGIGDRVHVLEDGEVVVGGVRFLGCTLWSDFAAGGDAERERAMAVCARVVNDYKHVSWAPDGRALRPRDTLALHAASRRWLEGRLSQAHPGPTVVVTHHGPLPPPRVPAEPVWRAIAGAFVSDLTDLMGGERVALWIHGHTHRRVDTHVRGTRVVSNPRGYPHEPVAGFEPDLVVAV